MPPLPASFNPYATLPAGGMMPYPTAFNFPQAPGILNQSIFLKTCLITFLIIIFKELNITAHILEVMRIKFNKQIILMVVAILKIQLNLMVSKHL